MHHQTARRRAVLPVLTAAIGDAVIFDDGGKRYRAHVIAIEEGRYVVHYDGFAESWKRRAAPGGGEIRMHGVVVRRAHRHLRLHSQGRVRARRLRCLPVPGLRAAEPWALPGGWRGEDGDVRRRASR